MANLSDFLDDLGDFLEELAEDFIDFLEDAIEGIASLYGFEDETITLSFTQSSPVYGSDYQNPLKITALNTVINKTKIRDEILNQYISGKHIHLRLAMRLVDQYDIQPEFHYYSNYISNTRVKPILEGVHGEEVVMISTFILSYDIDDYCYWFLENNPNHGGYTYDSVNRTLTGDDAIVWYITQSNPFREDGNRFDVLASTQTQPNNYAEFNEWIPAPPSGAGNQYEATYRLASDPPSTRRTWNHSVEYSPPYTYPTLLGNDLAVPSENYRNPLPIIPIRRELGWIRDLGPVEKEGYVKVLDKLGIDMDELTDRFINDDDGNIADIHSIWHVLAINIAKAESQAEIAYIFNFFKSYELDFTPNARTIMDDKDLVAAYANAYERHSFYGSTAYTQYTFNDIESPGPNLERMKELREIYLHSKWYDEIITINMRGHSSIQLDNVTRDPTTTSEEGEWNIIGQSLHHLIHAMNSTPRFEDEILTWKYSDYSHSVCFSKVEVNTITGNIGAVDTYTKDIDIAHPLPTSIELGGDSDIERIRLPVLTLRKQIDETQYQEVKVSNLYSMGAILDSGESHLVIGTMSSDAPELMYPESVLLPVNHGNLKEEGILNQKELLHRAAHYQLFGLQKIDLEWYETPAFTSFITGVITIVSFYNLFTNIASAQNPLYELVEYYLGQQAVEYVLQEILLEGVDDEDAQLLALVIVLGIGNYTSTGNAFDFDIARSLESVNATLQTVTKYTNQELSELQETSQEEQARIQQAIEDLNATDPAFLDYIKKRITINAITPEAFYQRHLKRSMVDEALDLDRYIDVGRILDMRNVQVTTEREV